MTRLSQAQDLAPSRDVRFLLSFWLGHGFSGIWPNTVLVFL